MYKVDKCLRDIKTETETKVIKYQCVSIDLNQVLVSSLKVILEIKLPFEFVEIEFYSTKIKKDLELLIENYNSYKTRNSRWMTVKSKRNLKSDK